jgi:flagellar basal body-associated protein FliL
MEARRAFQTDARSSQFWIVIAALLTVLALGVVGAYLAKGLNQTSAPSSSQVVQTSIPGRDPYSPRDPMTAPNTSAADPYSPRDPLGAGK